MTRRNFLAGVAAVTASPVVCLAQQQPIPVIGFLSSASPRAFAPLIGAFRDGLQSRGYIESRNVFVEYRWAEGHYGDLPALAAELVQRRVALIAATGGVLSAQAAKNATKTIPIVFVAGFDPVALDLVASLNNPGANLTGVSVFSTELATKRLEVLHDLLPTVGTIALLVNPGAAITPIEVKDSIAGAQQLGLNLVVMRANNETELEAAFASAATNGPKPALLLSADPFFTSRRDQVVAMAARFALPTMYPWREYVEAGGLLSYGTELSWAYYQIGEYAGRILQGTKPAELPVQLPTDFHLVINLKTAKALGLALTPLVLARVNETIE
jgi:putative ABC transport system substrate-binding protein